MAKVLLTSLEKKFNNTSEEYIEDLSNRKTKIISRPIRDKMPYLAITNVSMVHNNYLRLMYMMKKEEYFIRFGQVTEKRLYHSTCEENVMSIIGENFDWRRVSRSKFGSGVSFSDDPDYANFYSNAENGSRRAFIVADVLISNTCGGNSQMKVPPNHYDTAVGNNKVFVKFHDNEFMPLYVVFYDAPNRNLSKFYHRSISKYHRYR